MAHHAQNVQFQAMLDVGGFYPGEPWGKLFALDGKVMHQPEGLLSVRLGDVMVLHTTYTMSGGTGMPALSSPWAACTLLAGLDSKSCHESRQRIYLEKFHRGYMKLTCVKKSSSNPRPRAKQERTWKEISWHVFIKLCIHRKQA